MGVAMKMCNKTELCLLYYWHTDSETKKKKKKTEEKRRAAGAAILLMWWLNKWVTGRATHSKSNNRWESERRWLGHGFSPHGVCTTRSACVSRADLAQGRTNFCIATLKQAYFIHLLNKFLYSTSSQVCCLVGWLQNKGVPKICEYRGEKTTIKHFVKWNLCTHETFHFCVCVRERERERERPSIASL